MIDLRQIQIALEGWGAFITLICGIATFLGKKAEPRRSVLLTITLLLNTVLLVCDALAWVFRGNGTRLGYFMVRISNYIVFAVIPLITVAVFFYLAELLAPGERRMFWGWLYPTCIIAALDSVIIFVSQFTGLLYYFDENNFYHRADGFWVCTVLGGLLLLLLTHMIVYFRSRISKNEFYVLLCYVFLPFSSSWIQLGHYGLSLNNIVVTISLLLLFLTHEVGKSARLSAQQELLLKHEISIAQQQLQLAQKDTELAEAHVAISISQMQPHFIFNVLGCIEQLCKTDPKKAGDAMHHFARYLRSNLNALNSKELVSFSDEMQHIRTYIWLEKMRFDEDLSFHEDIEAEDFQLPVLSVQPIVENSIKHGIMGKEDGILNVTLQTREESEAYVITVSDDGCGFDPSRTPQDNQAHVGISNVAERIQIMCQGSIAIQSQIGNGTTVMIRIPKPHDNTSTFP